MPYKEVGLGDEKVTVTREEYWHEIEQDTPDPEPHVPECALHFIEWFFRLCRCRPAGMNGLEPIGDAAIHYWQLNSGERLSPREVDTLIAMDSSWRLAAHEDQEAKREREKAKGNKKR